MIDTSLPRFINLRKFIGSDSSFSPFSTYCYFVLEYSTTCPTIISSDEYPHSYGGACSPYKYMQLGFQGSLAYIGNAEGYQSAPSSAGIRYDFILRKGMYHYKLQFRYYAHGSDGWDGGDKANAEVILFGNKIWSTEITKCTQSFGVFNTSSSFSWLESPQISTQLEFRIVLTSANSWVDHRNFAIDDVIFEVYASKPIIRSVSMTSIGM